MENNSLWAILGPIISAVVGAGLGAILHWYFTRKRPQYLVCEEVSRTTLLEVPKEAKKANIRYGDTEVDRLSLSRLRLFNAGDSAIENAAFVLRLKGVKQILDTRFKTVPESLVEKIREVDQGEISGRIGFVFNETAVCINYLKPFKLYREEISIEIICDGEITSVTAPKVGEAREWGLKFWSLEDKKKLSKKISRIPLAFLVITGNALLAGLLLKERASPRVFNLVGYICFAFFVLTMSSGPLLEWIYRRRYGISL